MRVVVWIASTRMEPSPTDFQEPSCSNSSRLHSAEFLALEVRATVVAGLPSRANACSSANENVRGQTDETKGRRFTADELDESSSTNDEGEEER